ncbi:MAG: hypothetical protein ACRDPY_22255 [Streptosporangiaceae bacterium]
MSVSTAWEVVRLRLRSAMPLYPLAPPAGPATCVVCRGPAGTGYARCYQCALHRRCAAADPGRDLLADAVVPICYAVKGTDYAAALWRYKSSPVPSASAQTVLLALLLAFLNDHGGCVWRRAGMSSPDLLAVVPTGSGRPGPHPLLRLISPYLRLPLISLAIRPGEQGRDLRVDRFVVGRPAAGASVLLLDDTWVSGGSAQSAAAALKLAGARRVATVLLGRHINPADPDAGPFAARLAVRPYDPSSCAVHQT